MEKTDNQDSKSGDKISDESTTANISSQESNIRDQENTGVENNLHKAETHGTKASWSIWIIISAVLCFLVFISIAFGHHYFDMVITDGKNRSAKMFMIVYVGIFMISMGLIYFLFILDKFQFKNREDDYFAAKTIFNISFPGIILSFLGAILIVFSGVNS